MFRWQVGHTWWSQDLADCKNFFQKNHLQEGKAADAAAADDDDLDAENHGGVESEDYVWEENDADDAADIRRQMFLQLFWYSC